VRRDTAQTGPVTEETRTSPDELADLRELVKRARAVLWDFDGPVCRLFAGHSADTVARQLISWLESRGLRGLMTEGERNSLDPHVVLRAVYSRSPGSDLVAEAEERLTLEEVRAAATSMPTPYADPLIRTWSAVGARLAVATNNSPRAVRVYLESRGLVDCFHPYIYGRTQDIDRLKPDPHCLNLAVNTLGVDPGSAVMIGDSPSDVEAATRAKVSFLGYGRNERKRRLLREAGATVVVGSLGVVLDVLLDRA
jgi:HAD superfamily hydrolase (TIGR01509 family)